MTDNEAKQAAFAAKEYFEKRTKQVEIRFRIGGYNVIAKKSNDNIFCHIFSAANARQKIGMFEIKEVL